MSRKRQTLSYVAAHLIAAIVFAGMLITVPLAAMLVVIMKDNDPGGPLFLPIFVLMLVTVAFAIAGVLSCLTAIFDVLHARWETPLWVTILVILFTLTVTVGLSGASLRAIISGFISGLAVAVAFLLHWVLVTFFGRFLHRLAERRISRQKVPTTATPAGTTDAVADSPSR